MSGEQAWSEEAWGARRAAEAACSRRFGNRLVGYGDRSVVYLAEHAVLKIYTHRGQERCTREVAGLRAAAYADGVRVPDVLAYDVGPATLPWLVTSRLPGGPPDPQQQKDTAVVLGQAAARLHAVPQHHLGELAGYRRRVRPLPEGTSRLHQAGRQLDAALHKNGSDAEQRCGRGLVHGDFSSRNVFVDEQVPGVLDFEGCGLGCCYDDLATLVVHDALLGGRDRRRLLESYEQERQCRAPDVATVDSEHVAYHLVLRARWILQWAIFLDRELAAEITAATPWLLAAWAGTAALR